MTKHADEARKAAERIDKLFSTYLYDVCGSPLINEKKEYFKKQEDKRLNTITAIIDQETGLPELKARIKELEAEKAELVDYMKEVEHQASKGVVVLSGFCYGADGDKLADIVTFIRNKARAVLTKTQPESGEEGKVK